MLIDNKKNAGRAHHSQAEEGVSEVGTLPIFTVPSVGNTVTDRTGNYQEPFSDIICQPHLVSLPKETRTEECKKWTGLLGPGRRSFKMNLEVKKGKGKLEDCYNHSQNTLEWSTTGHQSSVEGRGTIHAINPLAPLCM